MIEENYRYWAPDGLVTPGGPSTWRICDWDQRRIVAVTMDEEQEEETTAIGHLKKHMSSLKTDVSKVHFSLNGELLSTSTDPEHNKMYGLWYPSLSETRAPECVETVLWAELQELDRFGPNVDLVSYKIGVEDEDCRKAVFKYYFLSQFIHRFWNEVNIVMRLPAHPNIVTIDKLVLDKPQGRIVGFTTPYIHGGTLDTDNSRVFKLKWLRQLTQVVDDLNFKFGVVHQDIAARNLLVKSETDDLMLFDFNFAGRIGYIGHVKDRDDVKGVVFTVYEIITKDDHFRKIAHNQQNYEDVRSLDDWVKHHDVLLDHTVSEYRSVLNEWVDKRRTGRQIAKHTEAPQHMSWPSLEYTDNAKIVMKYERQDCAADGRDANGDAQDDNETTIDWRRPLYAKQT